MTQREENTRELLRQLEDLFEGRVNIEDDFVPMTGNIELCGKTGDDRNIKDN